VSRFEAWLVHAANLLVGGTGLVYVWFRYLARPTDPFALVHPLAGLWQHAHVVAAPLLVFALGVVARSHAWNGLRLGVPQRRRSGALLLGVAAPMVLSGYLLQTAVDASWQLAWIGLHLAASALWLTASLAHLAGVRRPGR
jgi:hypothetical protein